MTNRESDLQKFAEEKRVKGFKRQEIAQARLKQIRKLSPVSLPGERVISSENTFHDMFIIWYEALSVSKSQRFTNRCKTKAERVLKTFNNMFLYNLKLFPMRRSLFYLTIITAV